MSAGFQLKGGGSIRVNNPSMVAGVANTLRDFNAKGLAFHENLLSMGVKAYRCNDGWVDRENHIITFFLNDNTEGWYWGNLELQEGDKIFIGDVSAGGKYAIVDKVIDVQSHYAKYHYNLIEERKQSYTIRLWRSLFKK